MYFEWAWDMLSIKVTFLTDEVVCHLAPGRRLNNI